MTAEENAVYQVRHACRVPNGLGLAVLLVLVLLALVGCNKTPPEVQTRLVEVPSSKPYKFITYTDTTPEQVAKQIRRHNRAHQEVLNAEKETKVTR